MLSKYYYLVSSLPYLRFGQASPIGKEAFLLECAKWLTRKDMDILSKASLNDFTIGPYDATIIREWKEFDFNLRKELALARTNRKYNRHEKSGPLVRLVLEEAHPLLMEQKFESIRWGFLESIESGNFFNLNFLIVYFLKLQISERLRSFDKETGKKIFESVCEVEYV
jgi:hypothetical protein